MIRIEVEPAQVTGEDRFAETRCRLMIDLECGGVEDFDLRRREVDLKRDIHRLARAPDSGPGLARTRR